jgi:hypothetical protein
MTGHQRLMAILNRQPVDRLAWTTLVDDRTRSVMPEEVRRLPVLDFYRHIGCDIMQFGSYGLPVEQQVRLARRVWPARESRTQEDATQVLRIVSDRGTLTAIFRSAHPVRYPIQTSQDLETFTRLWEQAHYEQVEGAAENCRRAEQAVGQDGMFFPTLEPSPVQDLIEVQMGLENFYYFLQDCPCQMRRCLDAMHRARLQEYEIVAQCMTGPAMIPVENTSSSLTGPEIYRRYSLPQIRDYVRIAHRHGRKVVLHMCGRLMNLLDLIAQTGADGINALTPPPVGDCPFEHALDVLGEDLVMMGNIFQGTVFHKPQVTREEIWRALDRLYTPRIRRAHMLLWLGADGLPTPLERFLAVQEWMEKNAAN